MTSEVVFTRKSYAEKVMADDGNSNRGYSTFCKSSTLTLNFSPFLFHNSTDRKKDQDLKETIKAEPTVSSIPICYTSPIFTTCFTAFPKNFFYK